MLTRLADKNGILISVIVPIYNTQMYLEKCIESILSQSYKNLDIILVDDGSTDGCGETCDEYALKDTRINVIHTSNKGLVSARKTGLEKSQGQFVVPIDSDDYAEPEMVEQLVVMALQHDADIVQCGVRYVFDDGRDYVYKESLEPGAYDLTDGINQAKRFLFWDFEKNKRGIRPNMWSCLFRKSVLYPHQMSVPDALTNGEDDACFYPTFLDSKRYVFIDEPLYTHYQRSMSMSSSSGNHSFDQVVMINETIKPYLNDYLKDRELNAGYKRYLLSRMEMVMDNTYGIKLNGNYCFPFEIIPKKSRVIVYGAGRVGQSYVFQNDNLKWFDLVAWVDSNRTGKISDKNIFSVSDITLIDCDFILIAVSAKFYDDVFSRLVEIGVDQRKILWKEPVPDNSTFFFLHD